MQVKVVDGKKVRVKNRNVLSFSFDDSLINDLEYFVNTSPIPMKKSKMIEDILRNAIPRRNLSTSN